MEWRKPDKGNPKYGRQCGEYRIAKVFLDGATLYELYHRYDLIKTCADMDDANNAAETHLKGCTADE